jgi:hypothetical protein
MLTLVPWRSSRAKYSRSVVQSSVNSSSASARIISSRAGPMAGAADPDSPSSSVVTP